MEVAVLDCLASSTTEVTEIRMLAWYGMVDERPVHVQAVLFWVSLRSRADGEEWALVQLGRNPDHNVAYFSTWHEYLILDTKWNPIKYFKHRQPTNDDVYSFLENWEFAPDDSWQLLTSGVRERTWKYVTGEAPTKFFLNRLSNNRSQQPAR